MLDMPDWIKTIQRKNVRQEEEEHDKIHDGNAHGPYCETTWSINSASTEYIIKSDDRET